MRMALGIHRFIVSPAAGFKKKPPIVAFLHVYRGNHSGRDAVASAKPLCNTK
jgi:hypothetical protein